MLFLSGKNNLIIWDKPNTKFVPVKEACAYLKSFLILSGPFFTAKTSAV